MQHGPGRPVVFNHIPKTAGTALREGLVAALRPQRVTAGFDRSVFGSFQDFDRIHKRVRPMVYLEPGDLPADTDFVTGHIAPSTTLARYPDAPHLTVLREPRTRILSLWLYTRTRPARRRRVWGPYGDRFLLAKGPLREFLTSPDMAPGVDNFITRFLAWPHPLAPDDGFIAPEHDAELVTAALARLERLGHVGLVEDPGMAAGIGDFLGSPLVLQRRNDGVSLPLDDTPDIEAEVDGAADVLAERSRLDRQVWQRVAAHRLPQEPADALAQAAMERAVARYVRAANDPDPAPVGGSLLQRAVRHGRGRLSTRR